MAQNRLYWFKVKLYGKRYKNDYRRVLVRLSLCYGMMGEGARAEQEDGCKTAQKENDNLCSLPIVKRCRCDII